MRPLWFLGGITSLGLGMIGVVLPLLPTVPFLLLATFCFARSSQPLHDWLVNHRTFGPPIADWRENGAIRPSAKRLATVSIAVVFGISLILGLRWQLIAVQAAVLSGTLTFIWTRPNG